MRKWIFILFLFLIAAAIVFSTISKPSGELNVFVLDNSSDTYKDGDHFALLRFLKTNYQFKGRKYDPKHDYYSSSIWQSDKIPSVRLNDIDKLVESYDVFYYVDARGSEPGDFENTIDARNSLGGINHNEYMLLRSVIGKKPVVLEHNLLSPPTNPLIVFKIEELLNIKYSGWRAKYFSSLNKNDVPEALVNLYEQINGYSWHFNDEGIIFINNSNTMFVLDKDKLSSDVPKIKFDQQFAEHYNLSGELNYCCWFEVVYSNKNNIPAVFNIPVNAKGKEVLRYYDLNNWFPAIIKDDDFIYFAGDFSKTARKKIFCNCGNGIFYRNASNNSFYKKFYKPFHYQLFEDILNETKTK